MSLIIVESPTKARTFNRVLKGKDYEVIATVGHFRDLPKTSIGIDYEKKFKPDYEIDPKRQKMIDKLLKLAHKHDEIILATDPDREGESISYHVAYVLGFIKEQWPDFTLEHGDKIKRIVFHEITPKALQEALEQPASLRLDLVKAQQARRILDRIVGYELSPLLWKKTGKNWLSAGRVQSVALRLVVEREKEIAQFPVETYYQIYAHLTKENDTLRAKLIAKDDVPYEEKKTLQLFAAEYQYTKTSIDVEKKTTIEQDLQTDTFTVQTVSEEVQDRFPPPPFTTSLLQQEAFRKHGFSSKMTMRLAQQLFENGIITYHRTDSFHLSSQFVFRAKDYIVEKFGQEYALEKPRGYKTKSRLAQEAHEAIRPTQLEKNPKKVNAKASLTANHTKLYDLIFQRAVATQMKEAKIKQKKFTINTTKGYQFEGMCQEIIFHGFLKLLNPEAGKNYKYIESINQDDTLKLKELEPEELQTKAPPRYTEASLIKILEEKGIGRPSTYASIISLIQDKHYIMREGNYFFPTNLGTGISDYLSHAFPAIFELTFTAKMEEDLDKIANSEEKLYDVLHTFFGPFHGVLEKEKKTKDTLEIKPEILDEACPQCGADHLIARQSRFGRFYGCSNYPDCKYIKPNIKYVEKVVCPKCAGRIAIRRTKKAKRFYGCEHYPNCDYVEWTIKGLKESSKKTA